MGEIQHQWFLFNFPFWKKSNSLLGWLVGLCDKRRGCKRMHQARREKPCCRHWDVAEREFMFASNNSELQTTRFIDIVCAKGSLINFVIDSAPINISLGVQFVGDIAFFLNLHFCPLLTLTLLAQKICMEISRNNGKSIEKQKMWSLIFPPNFCLSFVSQKYMSLSRQKAGKQMKGDLVRHISLS